MIRIFSFFFMFSLIFALGACAPGKKIIEGKPQVAASPDKVTLMLADAADRASVAIETLAAVEQARSPGVAVGPVLDAPEELKRAVTVAWVGPVEPITKMMAERAGYVFQVLGAQPPVPVVVSIDAENKPVIDVLRDLGLQLGVRADIRVDAARKIVELHYAGPGGVGL